MKIEFNSEEQDFECRLSLNESFHTFGGEYDDGDYHFDNYGMSFDNLSIYDIPSKQLESMATQMLNHLMTNGHDYVIDRNHNGCFVRPM